MERKISFSIHDTIKSIPETIFPIIKFRRSSSNSPASKQDSFIVGVTSVDYFDHEFFPPQSHNQSFYSYGDNSNSASKISIDIPSPSPPDNTAVAETTLTVDIETDEFNIHRLIKCFYPNYKQQDTQQIISMCISFSTESFRIVMATLLSLFVPQSCDGHLCSMKENVANLTPYNLFVITFNFLTLLNFIVLYYIEIRREKWMISHLEYDKNENEYNIYNLAKKYPEIIEKLKLYNYHYFNVYMYLRYLYLINIVFSGILVFYFYYLDYRTTTTFITNIILCWTKVIKGYLLAYRSISENIALSYYNQHYVSFNAIDPDYVRLTPRNSYS